ncbi:hypothetical protein [Mangrovitalea sediminis]|uniref:hypothetical protein n=1 Tax=Mangrovitalea sediminis TaxID=1982043 RepID=UPI000BE5D10C|nr:hypothetical protein [Mangrovitalea sediminis]
MKRIFRVLALKLAVLGIALGLVILGTGFLNSYFSNVITDMNKADQKHVQEAQARARADVAQQHQLQAMKQNASPASPLASRTVTRTAPPAAVIRWSSAPPQTALDAFNKQYVESAQCQQWNKTEQQMVACVNARIRARRAFMAKLNSQTANQ